MGSHGSCLVSEPLLALAFLQVKTKTNQGVVIGIGGIRKQANTTRRALLLKRHLDFGNVPLGSRAVGLAY